MAGSRAALEAGMHVGSPNRADAPTTNEKATGRVRRGETSSYEVLATRYQSSLYRLAQRFLCSEADEEDAVQGRN